jgi:SAM-dependent methyltransferase
MAERTEAFFKGTEMPNSGWWEALWPDPASVIAKVGIESGMDVVDLCSGDGWFTLQIAKIARRVVAIDIDAALLEIAKHRLREAKVTNCDFIAGDAFDLAGLHAGPVDFVFLANAYHGVPDHPRLSRAVGEALWLCYCQLAAKRARGNDRVGRAAWPANGIAHVA